MVHSTWLHLAAQKKFYTKNLEKVEKTWIFKNIRKKFNIFGYTKMCSFTWISQKRCIWQQKKLRKILRIQPKYTMCFYNVITFIYLPRIWFSISSINEKFAIIPWSGLSLLIFSSQFVIYTVSLPGFSLSRSDSTLKNFITNTVVVKEPNWALYRQKCLTFNWNSYS